LVGVAAHFGESVTGAAPSFGSPHSAHLARDWLYAAREHEPRSDLPSAGMRVLEALARAPSSASTSLAVYPNPANPDAWIPFRIDAPADVTVRVYATDGSLVRELQLGTRHTGVYTTRGRAAHWDGRNERGERAAAGRYVCEVITGGSRAVRSLTLAK
ncbi:hypothetical protein HOI71_06755, partial [Candidatus Poribacteria bacterium]|nr:hypothetical protein [Candidatus Poribacteria bacterium]